MQVGTLQGVVDAQRVLDETSSFLREIVVVANQLLVSSYVPTLKDQCL